MAKAKMTDVQRDGVAKAAAAVPFKWTPDSAVDASVNLRALVAGMFPGEELVKCRALNRHPDNPDRILAESYYAEGAIQPIYGLPFRVGTYARVKDDKGQPSATFRGGSASLTGYVPVAIWTDARFEELTEADGDGEP